MKNCTLIIIALSVCFLMPCGCEEKTENDAEARKTKKGDSGMEENMLQPVGQVTMKGNNLTLTGLRELETGDVAPNFEVIAQDLSTVDFQSDFAGKVCVIASVPSLDTSVCDKQTRNFNEKATSLSDQVAVLTISMDLPFAQKRWCGANGIENVKVYSDHRKAAFGKAYGVLIEELRLLGRAVFVVDKEGIIQYKQIVSELTNEPDYEPVLKKVEQLL